MKEDVTVEGVWVYFKKPFDKSVEAQMTKTLSKMRKKFLF